MQTTYTLGSWIKARRLSLGLTQAQLADRAGCAAETVRKIESGDRRPGRGLDTSLAKALLLDEGKAETFLKVIRGVLALDDLPRLHGVDLVAQKSLPSGIVTFLFTDVEGSTHRWENYGDAMAEALTRHLSILCRNVESHDGSVFKIVGDAIYAAFANATDALAGAIAAQQALCKENWSAVSGLRVRMGLLTDSVQAKANDYIGLPLNRAARLVAAAHGGQIVLSLATAELVRNHLPPAVSLRDLGYHQLKDISNSEHIFQVLAPEIPSDFPALVSQQSHTTHLPTHATALLGREQEVATLRSMLLEKNIRLLTLTGPGGVGKTRLAMQVAAELVDSLTKSIYFVSLGAIREPALVVMAIIQALGVREISACTPLESLKAGLLHRDVLLILDNFEQVLAAAPLVSDLLSSLPGLKVLVTSRSALRLSGEHEFCVPTLMLPDPGLSLTPHVLNSYAAIRLFVERAQAIQPDFMLSSESAAAVIEICQRLDGLPLAIELAAARIRLFPPKALLNKLQRSLTLLRSGVVDAPLRHQTLYNAIDWSYQLLDAQERALVRRIAVFAGHCTLEAIEAVCFGYGELPDDSVDLVSAVVSKSLMQRIDNRNGELCFRMLETIREYALEQLASSGEAELVHQRHADYFLKFAETAEIALHGPQQKIWLQALSADHNNLRAALTWSTFDRCRAEIGLRLATALWHFWEIQGHFTEGQTYLGQLLSVNSHGLPALRARALYSLASLTSDPLQASTILEESLTLQRALHDRAGVAASLQRLGSMAAFQGNYAKASDCLRESLEHYQALRDMNGIAAALHGLGDIARYRHELDQALLLQYEGLSLRYEYGNQHGVAWSLNNLAWLAYDLGYYDQAAVLHSASYDLFREIGDRWGIAAALTNMGIIARQQGDHERASQYLMGSLHHFCALKNPSAIAYVFEQLAALSVKSQSNADGARRAARLFGAASALREAVNTPVPPFDSVEYNENIDHAKTYLSDDTWQAAYLAGHNMPTELIIKEVLSPVAHTRAQAISPTLPALWITKRPFPPKHTLVAADVLRTVVQHVTAPLIEHQLSDALYRV